MTSAFSWQKEMIKKTNYELCAYYTRFCAKCGICAKLLQQCLTVCEPMFCSFPRSSVHGISRQEYWSRVPFPSPGNFPNPASPALAGRFFTTAHLGSHLLKKQGDLHLNTANILSNTLCFTHKVKNTRVHRKQFNNPSSTTATTASKSSN